jgi:hypothetical protein
MEEMANLHNNMGQKLSVNPQGKTQVPPSHVALNVVAQNGICHVTVDNGNNPRTRALHNWVEYDTDPNFSSGTTQVEHLAQGNQRRIPTMLGQPIYFRSYTMYADGEQQSAYKYASVTNDGGTSSLTYLQSTSPTPPANTQIVTTGVNGPPLPKATGSGTSPTAGRGFGIEKFVSNPTTPGKPPQVFK